MTKYVVEYRAEGTVEVEAETSSEATEKALMQVFALEDQDGAVDVDRIEQVRTYAAS